MKQKDDMPCPEKLRATKDAVDVINGKWRIPIIISLSYNPKRFGEIQRDVSTISPKMLSKELRMLEENKLITRTVYDSKPVYVEYRLTPLGKSLDKLLQELLDWGGKFRKEIIGKR